MRVLIIEDNPQLIQQISIALKAANFECDSTSSIKDALFKTEVNSYDVLLVDVNLPDGNGIDFIKEIRDLKVNTPALILTVHNKIQDKVRGLNAGADDYLTKPFSTDELVARIRTLTRRTREEKSPTLVLNDLKLDPVSHTVKFKDKKINLVRKEFSLLEYLMQNKGQVMTRPQLWESVWGMDDYPLNNTVDVHIASIRKKLKKINDEEIIKTVSGIGYKVE